MNTSTPFTTAILRAIYNALLAFGGTTLTTYVALPDSVTDRWDAAFIAGGIAACTALGWRAVAEGIYDQHRATTNDQKPSDVGYDLLAKPKPRR